MPAGLIWIRIWSHTIPHNLSAAAWPAAPGVGGGAAVTGTPPWAAAMAVSLQNAIADCTAATAANTAATAANTAATAASTAEMTKLLNRTSEARAHALRRNSRALDLKHPLVRVPHPDTGLMPPLADFPANVGALREKSSVQVNALSAFYGLPVVGVSLLERRSQLAESLGCMG